MKIKENIFDELSKMALTSTHPWAKVSAGIIYRGKVVSYGVNGTKSHPFQAKYSKNPEAIYPHAENAAIINAFKLGMDIYDIANTSLYVCRIKHPENNPKVYVRALAKPCDGCMRAILDFKIRNVVYSTGDDYIPYEVL